MRQIFAVCLLILSACSSGNSLNTDNITTNTVMITNEMKNSGGSGTIISRDGMSSAVLTNAHVCQVVASGGFVITSDGREYPVKHFTPSKAHDLCLIVVMQDLGSSAKIASRSPAFQEKAIVSGHPKLNPLTMTEGRFSSRRIIPIMIGVRVCTGEEDTSPETGLFCQLVGFLPVIKKFDSGYVSALIQPGSSGSGIYNEDGELSAVVFAGSGDLGFAWSVPYEYIRYFLTYELRFLTTYIPVQGAVPAVRLPAGYKDRITKICKKIKSSVCNELQKTNRELK